MEKMMKWSIFIFIWDDDVLRMFLPDDSNADQVLLELKDRLKVVIMSIQKYLPIVKSENSQLEESKDWK